LFQFDAQRLDRVRQAYEEHGLHRVSQQLNDLPGIGLDEDSLFAYEQVVFAISGDEVGETHVQLAAQQAKNAANLCKRDAPVAQLFDNQDVSEIGCGVDTVAPLARWNNDAALVPPLELPGGDTGQIEDLTRAEAVFQHSQADSAFKHSRAEMFDAILAGVALPVNPYRAKEIESGNYFLDYRAAGWCMAALTASVTR
jgi:hypothetical protein